MKKIIEKILNTNEEQMDQKIRCFTDVLIIFSNVDHSL